MAKKKPTVKDLETLGIPTDVAQTLIVAFEPDSLDELSFLKEEEIAEAVKCNLMKARAYLSKLQAKQAEPKKEGKNVATNQPGTLVIKKQKSLGDLSSGTLAAELLACVHNLGTPVTDESAEEVVAAAIAHFGATPVFAYDRDKKIYDVATTLEFIKRQGGALSESKVAKYKNFTLHTALKAGGNEKFMDMVNVFNPNGPNFIAGFLEGVDFGGFDDEMLKFLVWWSKNRSPISGDTEQWAIIDQLQNGEFMAPWSTRFADFKELCLDDEGLLASIKLRIPANFNVAAPSVAAPAQPATSSAQAGGDVDIQFYGSLPLLDGRLVVLNGYPDYPEWAKKAEGKLPELLYPKNSTGAEVPVLLVLLENETPKIYVQSLRDKVVRYAQVKPGMSEIDKTAVRNLVAQAQGARAITLLKQLLTNDADALNDLAGVEGQLTELARKERLGAVRYDDAIVQMVKIHEAILGFLK